MAKVVEQKNEDKKSEVKSTDEVGQQESPLQGMPSEEKTHVTTEELANSTHPKAPTHPIEVPKQPLADAFDTAEAAPEKVEQGEKKEEKE